MILKPYRISTIIILLILNAMFTSTMLLAAAPARQFYQILIYHLKNNTQEERVDKYLSEAFLPAVRRSGIKTAGVFKTFTTDKAADKKLYVLLTYRSLKEFHDITRSINNDKELAVKGKDYIDASYDDAPYIRIESILMEAFSAMPVLKKPLFTSPKSERIYELRSYESATEKQFKNKVDMFNKAEMKIFERIGSQPLFFGEVLAGSKMPNLMYMTTYSDRSSREEHWKTFTNDPEWKRISALPEYQHNMIKADIELLTPTEYSDL